MVFFACGKGMLVLDAECIETHTKDDIVFKNATKRSKKKVMIWDTDDFTYEEHVLGEVVTFAETNRELFGPLVDKTNKGIDFTICTQFGVTKAGPNNAYDYYRTGNFWILFKNNTRGKYKVERTEYFVTLFIDSEKRLFINGEFVESDCNYVSNPYFDNGKLHCFVVKKSGREYISLSGFMQDYSDGGVVISDSFTLKDTDSKKYRGYAEEEPDMGVSYLQANLICQ